MTNSLAASLPPEIWCQIFTHLHTPSFPSQSLPFSLTSHAFNSFSDPIRYRSVLLSVDLSESVLGEMEGFLDCLIARRDDGRNPDVCHLFLRAYNSQAEDGTLSRDRIRQNRALWMALYRRLSNRFSSILRLVGQSLSTLTIYLSPFVVLPIVQDVALPHLHEITFHFSPNQVHASVIGPRSGPSAYPVFTTEVDVDITTPVVFPSLQRLNITYMGDLPERNLALSVVRTSREFAPALSYLKLTPRPSSHLPTFEVIRRNLGAMSGYEVEFSPSSRLAVSHFPGSTQQLTVEIPVRSAMEAIDLGRSGRAEDEVRLQNAKQQWDDMVQTRIQSG
ncbi:hypothetical protein JAAARDRAFT_428917 [Jaapia argillacea MUCL 33604]|uniref:F-box domain-containing protein n=1 Tax=Jaapia argillacea MUCL 33604 TaxID=933084 RepID=A0A067PF77_9AGAM|nr:hypothetical protein JAAARDRAFT_428917 [Jaapia argillacea MUCL 33604]